MPFDRDFCVLTSSCMAHAPSEPSIRLRLHTVIDMLLWPEFNGGSLQAALATYVLDCSDGIRDDSGLPVWSARLFDPLTAPNASEAELYFMLTRRELFEGPERIDSDPSWKLATEPVQLTSCFKQLDPACNPDGACLRERGQGELSFHWQGPKDGPHSMLAEAMRASSPAAAVVVSFSMVPDVVSAQRLQRTGGGPSCPLGCMPSLRFVRRGTHHLGTFTTHLTTHHSPLASRRLVTLLPTHCSGQGLHRSGDGAATKLGR